MSDFRKELASLINKHSKENGSNTPDFILVEYLDDCLKAYDKSSEHRERWHTKIPVDQIEADELKFESDELKPELIKLWEDKSIKIESYLKGFLLADYSGSRGPAAFCGKSMKWKTDPIINDPFDTIAEALEAGKKL